MNSWTHNGFHVYCGKALYSWDNEGLERLGQYIVRAPLSQERMTYIPEDQTNEGNAKVVYKGKTSKKTQIFSALDWQPRPDSLPISQTKGNKWLNIMGFIQINPED